MIMGKKKGVKRKSAGDKIPLVNSDSDGGNDGEDYGSGGGDLNDVITQWENTQDSDLKKKLLTNKNEGRSTRRGGVKRKSTFQFDDDDSDEDDEEEDEEFSRPRKRCNVDIDDPDNSDLEDDRYEERVDEMAQVGAWGKKKKNFYGGNVNDRWKDDDNELDENEIESQETQLLQMKQMQELDEEDFMDAFADGGGSSISQPPSSSSLSNKEKTNIKLDFSKLSQKERLKLFKQDSPEFFGIVEDFKDKLTEAKDVLGPVVELMNDGKIPSEGLAAQFVKTRYDLILNYCTNISCYVMFKSKKISLKHHPLSGRLVQYKTLLDVDMKSLCDLVLPQVHEFLSNIKKGKKITSLIKKEKLKLQTAKKPKRLNLLSNKPTEYRDEKINRSDKGLTLEEQRAIEMYESRTKKNIQNDESDDDDDDEHENPQIPKDEVEEDEEGNRRSINYQIAKNKGLTPKRSKVQRNPRVKHRQKFEKAKVRRKGQVRQVRKEIKKYGGEMFGINARVKKGIKLQ